MQLASAFIIPNAASPFGLINLSEHSAILIDDRKNILSQGKKGIPDIEIARTAGKVRMSLANFGPFLAFPAKKPLTEPESLTPPNGNRGRFIRNALRNLVKVAVT